MRVDEDRRTGAPKGQARREDESELVARCARGDAAALEALYDRFSGIVCALVLRISGNRAEAEEITQEVFWQVWQKSERFDPRRGSLASWLFTMARNRALDVLRARGSAGDAIRRAQLDEPPSSAGAATPERRADDEERARAVRRALGELPAAQREALELAYYGGLSHAEIAARTGDPLGTVKSRIAQGILKLRGMLERFEP